MVRAFRWIVLSGVQVATSSGCTQSTEEACHDLAAVRCHHHATCSAAHLAASFGDEPSCRAYVFARCAATADLEGAHLDADAITSCVDAYSGHPCDALLLDAPPMACRFAGDRINGASCATGAQCQSSFCHVPAEGQCGKCAPVRKLGETCSKGGSPCDVGLHCGATLTCTPPGARSDACSPTTPCGPRLSCSGGECLPTATAGQPCDEEHGCDPLLLLACDPATSTCQPQETLPPAKICDTGPPSDPCAAPYPACP